MELLNDFAKVQVQAAAATSDLMTPRLGEHTPPSSDLGQRACSVFFTRVFFSRCPLPSRRKLSSAVLLTYRFAPQSTAR